MLVGIRQKWCSDIRLDSKKGYEARSSFLFKNSGFQTHSHRMLLCIIEGAYLLAG